MIRILTFIFTVLFTAFFSSAHAVNVGDNVPAFSAQTIDGSESVNIADLEGKVVFVDFWASWCTPCLKSLPEFEQLQTSFADRGDVEVLAINLDENPNDATKFLSKINITYKVLSDKDGSIPESFGVNTMPSSYLIDKSGIVRYVHNGYKSGDVDKIKAKIEQLL